MITPRSSRRKYLWTELEHAKKENATMLRFKIDKCETEEDLEHVSDLAEEMVQANLITKKAYRAIEEDLDDRLSYLVDLGKI